MAGLIFSGCSKDDAAEEDPGGLKISGVSIPPSVESYSGGEITLTGKGFAVADQIKLTLLTDVTKEYTTAITAVSQNSMTFGLPAGITSGNYRITVGRAGESLVLGTFLLQIGMNTSIPDMAGMTVKGLVYCNGKGLPGVVVSDGIEVTKTNNEGIYYLPSSKRYGYVFISVPGNYEVGANGNAPQFFQRLSGGTGVEQKNFSLIETNNQKHVVLALADWHLANRNDDLAQFTNNMLPDINSTISKHQASGEKVYALTLGDMTWDAYWYENNYRLNDYITQMNKINCPVFNVMGNHDNNPYAAGDWLAESAYRDIIGPTYYSFNLGNTHYIVLDNTEYINTGGAQGTIGERNYNDYIQSDQMEWLQKDLATLTGKTAPVVIAMHTTLYREPALDASGNPINMLALNNATALISALQDFSNVHILSGHTHVNYTVQDKPTLIEHNVAALSATWWWTGKNGYAGNHICKDGSPGGYGVWEADGTTASWYYKSMGYDKSYQFRSYDLNTVLITAERFAPTSTDEKLAPYAGAYASPGPANQVLINVWGYDPQWKIEVRENGQLLTVTRVSAKDPLHIVSYEAKRLNAGATPTSSFVTDPTTHMFRVTASAPNSTLEIKVTDRFGNTSTESMIRPKEFGLNMN
jgi:hypothetical protein